MPEGGGSVRLRSLQLSGGCAVERYRSGAPGLLLGAQHHLDNGAVALIRTMQML
jgi:hypothetical protein